MSGSGMRSLEQRCIAEGRERLLSEWHPDKNLPLTPDRVGGGSKKAVWWRCSECGHEWQTQVKYRVGYAKHKPTGCPECARRPKQTLREWCVENDRADILAEFDYERNTETPDSLSAHSNKPVHWRHYHADSEMEHPWTALVGSRTREQGYGCPYCAGVATLPGYNDLATSHPGLMPYWDWDANRVDPSAVPTGYADKVCWRCPECGHAWQATAAQTVNRARAKRLLPLCPECRRAAQKPPPATPGVDDLATTHPAVARWWHPFRNGDLEPSEVTASDARTVWWCAFITTNGRWAEWREPVKSCVGRIRAGEGVSPRLSLEQGVCDLATTHPLLSSEWSARNASAASEVRVQSRIAIWWRCGCCGHEWRIGPKARCKGSLCPECERRISTGARSLYRRIISRLDAVPVPTPLGPGVRCRLPFNPHDPATLPPDRPERTVVAATLLDCWEALEGEGATGDGLLVFAEGAELSAPLLRLKHGEVALGEVLDRARSSGAEVLGGFIGEDDAERLYGRVVESLGGSGKSSSAPTMTAPSLRLPSISE